MGGGRCRDPTPYLPQRGRYFHQEEYPPSPPPLLGITTSCPQLLILRPCLPPSPLPAQAVRRAVMTADYAAFFRLYATAPNLGRALMDAVAPKVRGGRGSRCGV